MNTRAEIEGAFEGTCAVPGGACTLDVTTMLLRSKLRARGAQDTSRVSIRHNDFRGAGHPYLASVRVGDREVFRVERRPDEVFAEDVLTDLITALAQTPPGDNK